MNYEKLKIVYPSVEHWKENDKINHVAKCARICYRKETGNDLHLHNALLKNKHWSMFRHNTYYYIVPSNTETPGFIYELDRIINVYKQKIIGIDIKQDIVRNRFFVVTNGHWKLDNPTISLTKYIVSEEEFANSSEIAFNMLRYTFKVVTQISTSRELNRVSPNNISEESTRYVFEDGSICKPHWMSDEDVDVANNTVILPDKYVFDKKQFIRYLCSCDSSFHKYHMLIDLGMDKQDARGVLPIDTLTVCAYTYSIEEWRRIIDLRYYGITGKPHPNAKLIAGMIRNKLIDLGYEFR